MKVEPVSDHQNEAKIFTIYFGGKQKCFQIMKINLLQYVTYMHQSNMCFAKFFFKIQNSVRTSSIRKIIN